MISHRLQFVSFLVLALAGLSLSTVWGAKPESIDWFTEYSAARRAGIDQDRPLVLFVTTEGCSHCERMFDDAFQDSGVIGSLNEKFVTAHVTLNSNDQLAKQLKVTLYPTTIIISTQGKILDYARGYMSSNELHQRLNHASALRVASVE